uniref:(northern house mosquito) hypothetical protein n=1 Tax=Culex pipiens TaxID=7175 RepID=A0A8D8GYC3_CULPI
MWWSKRGLRKWRFASPAKLSCSRWMCRWRALWRSLRLRRHAEPCLSAKTSTNLLWNLPSSRTISARRCCSTRSSRLASWNRGPDRWKTCAGTVNRARRFCRPAKT